MTTGCIRLYPINCRELGSDETFRKYDVISVDAVPANRIHAAKLAVPMGTLVNEHHVPLGRSATGDRIGTDLRRLLTSMSPKPFLT